MFLLVLAYPGRPGQTAVKRLLFVVVASRYQNFHFMGFTFLVPAHLGSTGQRAVKRVCVSVMLNCECCTALCMC